MWRFAVAMQNPISGARRSRCMSNLIIWNPESGSSYTEDEEIPLWITPTTSTSQVELSEFMGIITSVQNQLPFDVFVGFALLPLELYCYTIRRFPSFWLLLLFQIRTVSNHPSHRVFEVAKIAWDLESNLVNSLFSQ